jgi:hypothetical protein
LKNGKTVSEVKIRKGQYVSREARIMEDRRPGLKSDAVLQAYIPIEGLNWSHLFWGDDALDFK